MATPYIEAVRKNGKSKTRKFRVKSNRLDGFRVGQTITEADLPDHFASVEQLSMFLEEITSKAKTDTKKEV